MQKNEPREKNTISYSRKKFLPINKFVGRYKMASTKISKSNHNVLFSSLKSKGFARIRFVFAASNILSGKKQTFFVEFYFLNPAISPKRPVLFSEVQGSSGLLPSYCSVRCGTLGRGGKELIKYCSNSQVIFDKKTGNLQIDCFSLTDEVIIGSVTTSEGSMDWNLQYEKQIAKPPLFRSKKYSWNSDGIKTVVGGVLHFNGEEFQAVPNVSFGYSDFSFGQEQINPSFHISASNLVSSINGKQLAGSSFAVQKIAENKYVIFVKLEGKTFCIRSGKFLCKKAVTCYCTETTDEENTRQLHWAANIHLGKSVVDIDIYCHESSMYFREFDQADGKSLLSELCGGTGVGEVRYYRKDSRTKALEIIEEARVQDALCEFGSNKKL